MVCVRTCQQLKVKERAEPNNFDSIKTNFHHSQPMTIPNMQKYVVVFFREHVFINNTKPVLGNCAKTKQFWDGL